MRCRCRFLTGSGTSGNRRNVYRIIQQQIFRQRQQPQLYGRCETAGIGNVPRPNYTLTIQLGKTIHKIMFVAFDTEIHRKIDNSQLVGQGMRFHELTCIAMRRTEKETIDFGQRQFIGKDQIGFSIKSAMHIGNSVSRITGTVYKNDFHIGVIDEQPQQLPRRISGSAYDSNFYHERHLYFPSTLYPRTIGNYKQ